VSFMILNFYPFAEPMERFVHYFSLAFLLTLALVCCKNRDGKYPGFSKTSSGLYYRLLAFGDAKKKPGKDHMLELTMSYKTETDSIFLTTSGQNPSGTVFLHTDALTGAGLLGEGIMNMCEGDSTIFIADAGNVFDQFFHTPLPLFLHKDSPLKIDIRMISIMDKSGYEAKLNEQEEISSGWEVEEQRRIKQYLKGNKTNATRQPDGFFYIPLVEGKGARADSGRIVTVNYSGYFMDGRQFDAAGGTKAPFEFRIGDEYQVIWGLQQGIKLMKEGGKAKFIIPSYLAFGEDGSSSGIVPPNTTVLYEVELLKVK
jgi:FKBP-type peptidyl-prolyl cis-trans isomerase FkpA